MAGQGDGETGPEQQPESHPEWQAQQLQVAAQEMGLPQRALHLPTSGSRGHPAPPPHLPESSEPGVPQQARRSSKPKDWGTQSPCGPSLGPRRARGKGFTSTRAHSAWHLRLGTRHPEVGVSHLPNLRGCFSPETKHSMQTQLCPKAKFGLQHGQGGVRREGS